MRVIVGTDFSSRQVDVAAIPLNAEPILGTNIHLTSQLVGGSPKNTAERVILAGKAARVCLHALHARGLDIAAIAVEHPAGQRSATEILLPILGAILANLDAYPVCTYRPAEWRKLVGCVGQAVNTKWGGVSRVGRLIGCDPNDEEITLDALDAIGVALAHRTVIHTHAAA